MRDLLRVALSILALLLLDLQPGMAQLPTMPSPRMSMPKTSPRHGHISATAITGEEISVGTPACASNVDVRWLFPVRNTCDAHDYWGRSGFAALTQAAVTGQGDAFGASVEVISGMVGPLRLGLGLDVGSSNRDSTNAAAKDSAEQSDETLLRLLQGGGMVHTGLALPVVGAKLGSINGAIDLVAQGGLAWDAPQMGKPANDGALSESLALDLGIRGMADDGSVGFDVGAYAKTYAYNATLGTRIGVPGTTASVLGWRFAVIIARQTEIGFLAPLSETGGLAGRSKVSVYIQQVKF